MPGPDSSPTRFYRGQLLGQKLHYLLDVTWASQTFRLSRETIVVPSDDGDLVYEGSIEDEIEWEEGIDLFSDSADAMQMNLSVVLPVDVPKLIQMGHALTSAVAQLSLWIEGTTYEERRVLMDGTFADPEYGADGEPINVSIQAPPFEDGGLVPPASQVIDADTWPLAADNAEGLAYPFVFGEDESDGPFKSPAYVVDTTLGAEVIIVAGHAVDAANVTVGCSSDTTGTNLGVSQGKDGRGQVVSIVTIGGSALVFTTDDDFWVRWGVDGGGAFAPMSDGPLTGAGDVIEHMLRLSTLKYDQGRVAAAKQYLNTYKVGGYISEGVSPWEWITSNLSPILPMSICVGSQGVYVVPWRYDALARDAVDHLDVDADPHVERDGNVEYEGELKDIVNSFVLKYNIKADTGDARSSARLAGTRDPVNIKTNSSNVYCEVSESRYGVRSDEQESTVIYKDSTAALVLNWWSRAKALPMRVIHYLVGDDRSWLDRGDVVVLSDKELHLEQTVCLVDNIVHREDGNIRVSLRLIEDPAREFKQVK